MLTCFAIAVAVLLLAAADLAASEVQLEPTMSVKAMQTAIDKPGRKHVVFKPGEYKFSGLVLRPANVHAVSCFGAKFSLPDKQKKDARIFSILQTTNTPGAVLFEGGSFDLNEQGQGRDSYNKEQQGAIFIDSTGVRLPVALRDVSITNSAGDGICVHRNALVSLDHVQATECFRSSLTISAGGNQIIANHLDVRGKRFRSGVRFEPSGFAARQIPATYILRRVQTNYFNFQLGAGSLVYLTDSKIEPANPAWGDHVQGYIYNEGGRVRIARCEVRSNRQINFMLTGDSRISHCDFELCKYNAADLPSAHIAITLRWFIKGAGKFNDGQRFALDACRFTFGDLDPQTVHCSALRVFDTNYAGAHNRVLLTHCRYAAGPWTPRIRLLGQATSASVIERGETVDEVPLDTVDDVPLDDGRP